MPALTDDLKIKLLGAVEAGQLIFLCGAGLSMPGPSNLPSAKDVSRCCFDKWNPTEPLDPSLRDDVDKLAGHFYAKSQFTSVFLSLVPWNDLEGPPNKGHAAVADFLVSRAAHGALSANFDTMVEKWAKERKISLLGALDGQEAVNFTAVTNPLLKFHGCMDRGRPDTLWTQSQLGEADVQKRVKSCSDWMTQNLPGRHLLVIGFWTDWGYLNDVLADAFKIKNAASVTVVDPSTAAELEAKAPVMWAKLKALSASFEHVQASGADLLDELRIAFSRAWAKKFFAIGAAAIGAAGSPSVGALTEARSVAERQTNVSRAEAIIRKAVPGATESIPDHEALGRLIAERKQAAADLTSTLSRAVSLKSITDTAGLDTLLQHRGLLEEQISAADTFHRESQASAAMAEERMQDEMKLDEFASRLTVLLDHGEALGLQDHHCPLCDAARTDEEFARAISDARARLNQRGERVRAAVARVDASRAKVADAEARLRDLQNQLTDLNLAVAHIIAEGEAIQAEFDRSGITASISDIPAAERQLLQMQDETNELEQALYILEASGAHDRVTALAGQVEQLRIRVEQETARLAAAERAVEIARQIKNAATTVSNEILTEQFDTVMPLLKELYRRLRPHTDWQEIETDFGGKIRASLNFTVGDGKNPQFLFSSGQRRAAGLAFLLAIHLSRPWCRLKSLWLDDPVQHVDDYRALNLVEVLSAIRKSGRQIVVAVEDPALANLLCRRLRSSENEPGCLFEVGPSASGTATIQRKDYVSPMMRDVLRYAEAS
jgi:hypothetical protein